MGSALLLPRDGVFIHQKTPRSGTYRKKNPKGTKQPSAHISPALPCHMGQASWLSACSSRLSHPCLCLPISHVLAELMKDDGARPPVQRGRQTTCAGEREVQWGLGGHRQRRRNKGSCWFITETGAFGSLTRRGAGERTGCQPGCALCLLIEDGRDLLVTSSGPASPDSGCS